MLLGVIFVAVSNLFAIYPAQVIGHAFDLIAESLQLSSLFTQFSHESGIRRSLALNAFMFGLLVIVLALLKGLFTFFMRQTIIVVSRLIEYDLKNEIFNHYQKLGLAFYKKNNTGDLMARISEDVSRVRMYLGPAIMYTINLIVLFILVVSTMISVNPRLTLYVLLPLPLLSFSIWYVHSIIIMRSERVQSKLSDLSTFVQESFSGVRVLKSFGREEQNSQTFAAECDNYKDKSLSLVKVNALFQPIMLILIGLSTLLTVYVGGLKTISGEISAGNIAEFIIYVNMLTWPVTSLGWVTSLVQRAAASQERINEFLHTKPEIVSVEHGPSITKADIEFKNVSFIYPDSGIRALENVSFKIEDGKSLAILGRTGSGKSTIAHLISRLYDPTSGEILIGGINIKEYPLDHIRNEMGYVPQDVFLFSDTLAENIAFGKDTEKGSKREELIKNAAKQAAVFDNISEFPLGFETRLGERGITLSGGQKQRVSIARALIREPRILVLDDSLSAVDTKTEETILENLKDVIKNRTSILISHRISTLKYADHILVIDAGKSIEYGTHKALLEQGELYAELYEKQLTEEDSLKDQL